MSVVSECSLRQPTRDRDFLFDNSLSATKKTKMRLLCEKKSASKRGGYASVPVYQKEGEYDGGITINLIFAMPDRYSLLRATIPRGDSKYHIFIEVFLHCVCAPLYIAESKHEKWRRFKLGV